MWFKVKYVGCRVQGARVRVYNLGCTVKGLCFRV
jgi:hypothetical protein